MQKPDHQAIVQSSPNPDLVKTDQEMRWMYNRLVRERVKNPCHCLLFLLAGRKSSSIQLVFGVSAPLSNNLGNGLPSRNASPPKKVQNPVVSDILISGYAMHTIKMDMADGGIYRLTEMNKTLIFRSLNELTMLPIIVSNLLQLKV